MTTSCPLSSQAPSESFHASPPLSSNSRISTIKKIIEAHIENLKLVKEQYAPLDQFPTARMPLQNLEDDPSDPPPPENTVEPNEIDNDFLGFLPDDPYLGPVP